MCVLPYTYSYAQGCDLSCSYSNDRSHWAYGEIDEMLLELMTVCKLTGSRELPEQNERTRRHCQVRGTLLLQLQLPFYCHFTATVLLLRLPRATCSAVCDGAFAVGTCARHRRTAAARLVCVRVGVCVFVSVCCVCVCVCVCAAAAAPLPPYPHSLSGLVCMTDSCWCSSFYQF